MGMVVSLIWFNSIAIHSHVFEIGSNVCKRIMFVSWWLSITLRSNWFSYDFSISRNNWFANVFVCLDFIVIFTATTFPLLISIQDFIAHSCQPWTNLSLSKNGALLTQYNIRLTVSLEEISWKHSLLYMAFDLDKTFDSVTHLICTVTSSTRI